MSISAGIDSAIAAAPGLLDSPGLALDASTSTSPSDFAPALSQGANISASGDAITQNQADDDPTSDNTNAQKPQNEGGIVGFFGHAAKWLGHTFQTLPGVHGAEHAVSTAASYLAKPLQEVQRDYRFIHDVYAKQGILAGFLYTAGIAGGAALGTLAGGNAIEGAEAALYAEKQIAGTGVLGRSSQDSALDASDPNAKISFGRDLANAIGEVPGLHTFHNTNEGFGKVLSGGADALADFSLDPVVLGAKLKTGFTQGEMTGFARDSRLGLNTDAVQDSKVKTALRAFVNGDLTRVVHSQALQNTIDNVAPGLRLTSPEQLAALYGPGEDGGGLAGVTYRRFLDHIVQINRTSKTPSADIARLYPQTANLAFKTIKDADGNVTMKGLASATTRAEANQVYVDVASRANMAQRMVDSNVLPTRTITRGVGQNIAEWLRGISPDTTRAEQPGLVAGAGSAVKTLGSAGGQLLAGDPTAALKTAKDAGGTLAAAAAGKFRTFTGYKAFAMNKATNAISSDSVPWVYNQGLGPGGYRAWMNVAQYGMGTTQARYWLDQLQNAPDFATAKAITNQITFEARKGMGLPDDPNLVDDVHKMDVSANSNPVGGPGDVMGIGKDAGRDVGNLANGDGGVRQQALWTHQASGELSFPNFEEMLLSHRQMSGAIKANYGKYDDIAARKYTGPVFKTAALLNAGFALRVSLAEALPQAIRVGVMNHLKSQVASTAAKKGYKLDLARGEDEHLLATTAHALSTGTFTQNAGNTFKLLRRPLSEVNTGMWRGLNVMLNDPARRAFAETQIMAHGGHMAIGAATTNEAAGGYGYDNEPATRANHGAYLVKSEHKNDPRIGWKGTKDFDTFSPNDDVYDGYWHNNLQKAAGNKAQRNIAGDLGATDDKATAVTNETNRIKAALNNSPDADPAYVHDSHILSAYANINGGALSANDLAVARVDAMRGMLHGADGTYHGDIAAKLAAGEKPALDDISDIPFESRPAQTYGPLRVPYYQGNILQRIAQKGYAKTLDPMIAHLSRDPIFSEQSWQEYQGLKHFVSNGMMDEDTAMRLAETRATKSMLPKIHNTALRSQFSVLARNFMPFYFAQEQALKRAGLLVATHPNALRQYQLVEQGLSDPGFVHRDAEGNKSVIFPASGVFGKALDTFQGTLMQDSIQAGLPLTVSGNMSSLNTVLPELNTPGVSPFVSIPLNKIAAMFPELSPFVKDVVGERGFNQSALNALVPSPITKGLQNYIDPDTASASFANAWYNSIASAYYHGDAPGPNATKGEQAAFLARMKNNTRSGFLLKALVGLVSPLAPSVSQGTPAELGFRDEFEADIKKYGIKDAYAKFAQAHGSSSVSYTISHTAPSVDGATMPYTQAALDWINQNKPLINSQFGRGAAFLVPQTTGPGDIQTIHSELLRQQLRIQDTPEDFLNNIDIAAGNAVIGPGFQKHKDFQAANAGDTASIDAENKLWGQYIDTQGFNNPIWHDYWTSSSRTNEAQQAYDDMLVLFQASGQKGVTVNGKKVDVPSVPNTEQSRAVYGLVQDYEAHKAALAGFQGNFAGEVAGRKTEKANWAKFLDDKANSDQILAPVIQAVFSRLDAAGA